MGSQPHRPKGARPAANQKSGGRRRWKRAYSRQACAENLIRQVSAQCAIPTVFVDHVSAANRPYFWRLSRRDGKHLFAVSVPNPSKRPEKGLSRDRGDQAAFANCGHGGEIGLNTRPSPAPNMPL